MKKVTTSSDAAAILCRRIGLVAAACAAWLPGIASAEGEGRGPYFGLQFGLNQPGDQHFDLGGQSTDTAQPPVPNELELHDNSGPAADNEYKQALVYQAVLGYAMANGLRPEFELSLRRNKADRITNPDGTEEDPRGVKLSATSGMANLWYDLLPSWRLHPYVGGGVGFMSFRLKDQKSNVISQGEPTAQPDVGPAACQFQSCSGPRKADDAVVAYQLGAGLQWALFDKLTLGLDYRYLKTGKAKFYAYKDQPETFFEGDYETQSVMLSAHYFFARPAAPVPPAAPPPPAVVPVATACADGQDNDQDGKVDFPADAGCSSAEDGDETDPPPPPPPCKTPVPGERISLGGCGTGDVIVLRGVNFEFDRATLTANARTLLDDVAAELHQYADIKVEISGHTDAKGSDAYNQRLSEERARSVVQYLEDKGIDAVRMTFVGFGESKPVADNETEEGRELNRRVELRITAGVSGAHADSGDSEEPAEPAPAATESAAATPAPAAPAAPTDTDMAAVAAEKDAETLDWLGN